MRGKKSNPEFISQFISQCLQQGILTDEEIVEQAKQDIQDIDNKIVEVEKLKIVRTKLLDVVLSLDKTKFRTEESRLLPLFKLQYPQTCKKICDNLLQSDFYSINNVKDPELLFCLKQLLESKVITRIDDSILRGDNFDDYMKFILHEAKC